LWLEAWIPTMSNNVITDILPNIFHNLTTKSLHQASLVSKSWNKISLPIIEDRDVTFEDVIALYPKVIFYVLTDHVPNGYFSMCCDQQGPSEDCLVKLSRTNIIEQLLDFLLGYLVINLSYYSLRSRVIPISFVLEENWSSVTLFPELKPKSDAIPLGVYLASMEWHKQTKLIRSLANLQNQAIIPKFLQYNRVEAAMTVWNLCVKVYNRMSSSFSGKTQKFMGHEGFSKIASPFIKNAYVSRRKYSSFCA